jgi:LmbE family N-acetylglucosaminyl deacetylase
MQPFPKIKNKNIVAVFAHPDDESFGPSGALAKLAKDNNNLFLIVVTDGSRGLGRDQFKEKLSQIRKKEVEKAATILGVKKVFFLNYQDGTLCNKLYHQIAEKIFQIIKEIAASIILTYENLGVSGHLDHIAVSLICSYLYEKHPGQIKKIFYYCLLHSEKKSMKDYFIFWPQGYYKKEINYYLKIDQTLLEKKIAAIKCHQSQKKTWRRSLKKTFPANYLSIFSVANP